MTAARGRRYSQIDPNLGGATMRETKGRPQSQAATRSSNQSVRTTGALAFLLPAILVSVGTLSAQTASFGAGRSPEVGAQLTHSAESCAETIAYNRGMLAAVPGDLKLELQLARSLAACHRYGDAVVAYRQILHAEPDAEYVVREAGEALFRAGRGAEAIPVYRKALALNPEDWGVKMGLARALAARGSYTEALQRYDEVLEASPGNYDALQGKALTLYWSDRFVEARSIFDKLHRINPADEEVRRELQQTYQAHEDAYWAALRPPAGGKAEEYLSYYQKRLTAYPKDRDALKAAAYYRVQLNDSEGAIRGYRQLLEAYPDDRDARVELARLLAQKQDYAGAISLDQELLQATPHDVETMESLARLYTWSGQLGKAFETYQALSTEQPANRSYRIEEARLEFQSKNYPAVRNTVAEVLSADPQNRAAHLLLAQLDLKQGHLANSLRQFEQILAQDPKDRDALYGKAQVEYYQGRLRDAQGVAERLVKENPKDFDALVLLASIERARSDRQATLSLLDRAARLSPNNPEVETLRRNVEWRSSLHTSASYAREIGEPGRAPIQGSASAREDLRTSSLGTRFETAFLPRSECSLSLSALPSESPLGAIRGATAPDQFMYQQSTRVSSYFTLRGGAGLMRFGPGTPQNVPGQPEPIVGAATRPIGFLGGSLWAEKKARFDLSVSRSAIIYTPLAVRLGVVESRLEGGLSLFPTPNVELHLSAFDARFESEAYDHVTYANVKTKTGRLVHHVVDREQGGGGSLTLNWNAVRRPYFGFDTGYSALAYGFDGARRNVYLGFFNPSFYQRHLLTTRFYGKLSGPVGYDFSSGFGVQQVEQGRALTRAVILSPAFSVRASSRVTFNLGYTYYNFAETLGVLTGNSVQLSTDYRF